MIWGAISSRGTGPLVRVDGTLKGDSYLDLFRYRLRRYYPGLYDGSLIFQQDNAPPHRALLVKNWFEKYEIEKLVWPSRSPDLNLIEDVWGRIKFSLRGQTFETEDELWRELQIQWRNIPNEFIEKLYQSMPNRIQAVISSQGGNTKY